MAGKIGVGLINLEGKRFGRWTVLSRSQRSTKNMSAYWNCVCDCGTKRAVPSEGLRSGRSQSCGCRHKEIVGRNSTRHGDARTLTYVTWQAIKARCYSPCQPRYPQYGGRGITMCDRWRNDYSAFLQDMGLRPSGAYSIDRIDTNGNYEPGNCRWATRREQARNKRDTRFVEYRGIIMRLIDVYEQFGSEIKYCTFAARLAHGWPIEVALKTPVGAPRGK